MTDDYRTAGSRTAEARVLALCGDGPVIGLGGGPRRAHPHIINLNIAPFANVDITGDAHHLPLADASVNGVHCEAVFEHLEHPTVAAAEMFRVMKPGAVAYVCTPFLQPFHAYPSHFQNFTLEGHKRLFARAGFSIVDQGVAVGPAWATSTIVASFIAHYAPAFIRWPLRAGWAVVSRLFLRPLDRWLSNHKDAHIVASTTYVLLEKPPT